MNKGIEPSETPWFRSARRLVSRKGREQAGLFLVEGRQAVREALRARRVVRVFVDDWDRHLDLLEPASPNSALSCDEDPPVTLVSAAQLRLLSDTVTPQGVVAVCRDVDVTYADVVDPKLVVICQEIRDPGNAGTVIRCADAFGADAVILTKGSVELTNPKTIRASVGSIFHLPIIRHVLVEDAMHWCRDKGLQVFAADGGGVLLSDIGADLARPTAWLMGNEAWGLPPEIVTQADQAVGVPMWGQAESLNLASAASVCLYSSAAAQRGTSP